MLQPCENEIPLMGSEEGVFLSGVVYTGLQEVEMTATLHGWNETSIMLSILIMGSYDMPLIGSCVWMQSGGRDSVAILTYKSRTTESYEVNRNIKL